MPLIKHWSSQRIGRIFLVFIWSMVATLNLQVATPVYSKDTSSIATVDCQNIGELSSRRAYTKFKSRYSFTEHQNDIKCAIQYANKAFDNYNIEPTQNIAIDQIRTDLNRLSLTIDVFQWLYKTHNYLFLESSLFPALIERNTFSVIVDGYRRDWANKLKREFQKLVYLEMSLSNLKQNSELSSQHVYIWLNYASSLLNIRTLPFLTYSTRETLDDWQDTLSEYNTFWTWENIRTHFDYALQLAKNNGNRQSEAYALAYYGYFYEIMGDKGLDGSTQNQCLFLGYYIRGSRSRLNCAKKLTEEALSIVESELANSSANSSAMYSWKIMAYKWQWQLGRIYKQLEERDLAVSTYKLAVQTVEFVRKALLSSSEDKQFSLRDEAELVYREYIDLLLKDSPSPDLSEKSLPNSLKQQELREASEVFDLIQLGELENLLDCPLESIRDVEQVTGADPDVATVRAFILGNRIETIWQFPGEERLYSYSFSIDQLNAIAKLKLFQYELQKPYFSSIRGMSLAQEIYRWLIKPAEDKLARTNPQTLVFILDGALRNIPMAALHSGSQFLIEEYAIATALGNLRIPEQKPSRNFRLLIGGISAKPDFGDFSALPYISEEIKNISTVFSDAEVLSNENLTFDELQSRINSDDYNVLHLATHGQFGFSQEDTFLILSSSNNSSDSSSLQNNEQISAARISLNRSGMNDKDLSKLFRSRLRRPLELLVLSACETATGSNRDVLGIAGMTVQTGSHSTLATLWSVNDLSTAELMQKFYEQLRNSNLSKAEALRAAQLYLLQDNPGKYKPSAWAPYILVGDWR